MSDQEQQQHQYNHHQHYHTEAESALLTLSSLLEMAALRLPDTDTEYLETRRRLSNTGATIVEQHHQQHHHYHRTLLNSTRRVLADMLGNSFLDLVSSSVQNDSVAVSTESAYGEVVPTAAFETTNVSTNSTLPDLLYRHSLAMTVVYCVAYLIVFIVGLVGNCFVIAVVYRSPRMRTVTNFFIVNLAVADILVIVFCLPATLMSNIFVRKYFVFTYACYLESHS